MMIVKQQAIRLAYLGQLLSVSRLLTAEATALADTPTTTATATATTTSAEAQATSSHVDREPELVEIKVGFLVGSRRLDRDHTYSRPGRQLKYAFNYAIDKFNQFNSDVGNDNDDDDGRKQTKTANSDDHVDQPSGDDNHNNDDDNGRPVRVASSLPLSSSRLAAGASPKLKIKLRPIIRETYGSESESIRQTIELITKHGVNFIFGPQETCQMEPKVASIFNVAMLSHYCTTWAHDDSHFSSRANGGGSDGHGSNRSIVSQPAANRPEPIKQSNADTGTDRGRGISESMAMAVMSARPEQQATRQTFIQIKPPHWRIVSRVVALVEQLLAVSHLNDNGKQSTLYPQQLVLLYFKGLPSKQRPELRRQPHEPSASDHLATDAANDAIQYTLIGELLEIKLNELIASQTPEQQQHHQKEQKQKRHNQRRASLSALNWHTTFHYGYTKNPFRAVLRRHLFGLGAHSSLHAPATNQSESCHPPLSSATDNRSRLSPSSATDHHRQQNGRSKSRALPHQTEAIYIVVGHYYEHLGLMLALNELNLLPTERSPPLQANDHQAQEAIQSSVGIAPPPPELRRRRRTVVIGVDTEPYDERDDSVRFLRGLLMDSVIGGGGGSASGGHTSPTQPADELDLDSISNLYRAYLGVVPAKPAHLIEFLNEMRSLYANETGPPPPPSTSIPFPVAGADSIHESPTTLTAANNQTYQHQQQQLQLSARLLQFIRLPVEAFYLYDAVMLLGLYLKDCLLKWGPNGLAECGQGNRTFEWFRGRDYKSHVTHKWGRFDSLARADGSYNLITRRKQSPIDLATASSGQDEDSNISAASATLIPIGYFSAAPAMSNENAPNSVNSTIDRIQVHLSSWDDVDPIWLPFWCHVRKDFTSNACLHLFQPMGQDANGSSHFNEDDYDYDGDGQHRLGYNANGATDASYPLLTIAIVMPALMLILVCLVYGHHLANKKHCGSRSRGFNAGWFSELDETNFLELIYKYLLAPEAWSGSLAPSTAHGQEQSVLAHRKDMLVLHCNMFAFPSCMFVHWLTAMHQLKEMLFKFKSKCNSDNNTTAAPVDQDRIIGMLRALIAKSADTIRSPVSPPPTERQFFSIKHSGTNSLRLLLNKYKQINECLINLIGLNHDAVAELHGITMSCSVAVAGASRTVYLILELPDRGNLRQALKMSTTLSRAHDAIAGSSSWFHFQDWLLGSLIEDLLGGLEYLHGSSIEFHGDLRSTTCLISYDWRLKLSGFHANHLRRSLGDYEQKLTSDQESSTSYFDQLIYSAPELIRNHSRRFSIGSEAMKLADIYSFAFVAYELLSDGVEPWASCSPVRDGKLIVDRVKDDAGFRPSLSKLDITKHRVFDPDAMLRTIRSCWSQSPERRPQSVGLLRMRFCAGANPKPDTNELMRTYTSLIESSCRGQRKLLKTIKRSVLDLKLKLLPANIVARLGQNQSIKRQHFECVSFGMFRLVLADGLDSLADPVESLGQFVGELMKLVNQYRNHLHLLDSQADSLMRFMVYSGEPLQRRPGERPCPPMQHAQLVASFALQVVDLVARLQADGNPVQVRFGLHCGPVFGGLLASDSDISVGKRSAAEAHQDGGKLARYILIGPAMMVANLLEQTSQSQRIQISAEFRAQLLLAERLLPSLSAGAISMLTTTTTTPTMMSKANTITDRELVSRQGYVIVKREARIQPARMPFSGGSGSAKEFDAYWLLNGPRLSASQSLMLLTRSCDTPTANPGDDNSEWELRDTDEGDGIDDYDDDWHHNHHWTHLPLSRAAL